MSTSTEAASISNDAAPTAAVAAAVPGSSSPRIPSLRSELQALFKTAIQTAYPSMTEELPLVAACGNTKNGDYQCNNAMALFGRLKGKEGAPRAPRDAAIALVAALPPNEIIASTSLAGPGFINIRLNYAYLAKRVNRMLKEGMSGSAPSLEGKRVVVDFSSPNVAKEMHVGHLRSTIIGELNQEFFSMSFYMLGCLTVTRTECGSSAEIR